MATGVRPIGSEPDAPRRGRLGPERVALALPGVFLAVVFGFFFITKPSEAWTATKSVQAILVIAGIIGGWVLLGWLLRRFVRWVWVRAAVLSVVAVVIAVLLVRPYYVDTVDNTKLVKGPVQDASQASPPAEAGSPAPVRVSAGQLRGIDHSASGEASIIRQPDGSHVVRFSNFDIQSSPDPIVYVLAGENRENPGGADLGRLRGNVGTDSDYLLPGGTEPGPGWTVLVWCRAFAVPIANATQAAV